MRPKTTSTLPTDFETTLQKLSGLVSQMEKGDLPLQESLKNFEEGVQLIRQCQTLLQEAEQRIQIYQKSTDSLQPFESSSHNEQA